MQQRLAQMLSRVIKIAEEFNVAVYMTNQGNTRSILWSIGVSFSGWKFEQSRPDNPPYVLNRSISIHYMIWILIGKENICTALLTLCEACLRTHLTGSCYVCSDSWSGGRSIYLGPKETSRRSRSGPCSHSAADVQEGQRRAARVQGLRRPQPARVRGYILPPLLLLPIIYFTLIFLHLIFNTTLVKWSHGQPFPSFFETL